MPLSRDDARCLVAHSHEIFRSVGARTKYRAAPTTTTFERAPRATWTCVRIAGLIRANISP